MCRASPCEQGSSDEEYFMHGVGKQISNNFSYVRYDPPILPRSPQRVSRNYYPSKSDPPPPSPPRSPRQNQLRCPPPLILVRRLSPSPVTATISPCSLSRAKICTFCSGDTRAKTAIFFKRLMRSRCVIQLKPASGYYELISFEQVKSRCS